MEDSEILDLFFERSEQAIRELDNTYGAVVKKTAANLLRSPQNVEECVNDAYLGVWNSIPPHRPNPLVSYVCRIVRNLAVSRLRSETAAKRNSSLDLVLEELEDCIPAKNDVEGELEAKELAASVDRFLNGLPYTDRYLFVCRYWFADPVHEIALHTGLKVNRVSVRLFRLREKLRKHLQKEGLLA